MLKDFFSRLTFRVNSYTDNQIIPDMDLKDFKLGFYVLDGAGNRIPDIKRIITISGFIWDVEIPKQSDTVSNTTIPRIDCSQYKNDSLLYEEFKNFPDLICIDLPSLNKKNYGVYGSRGK